MKNKKILFVVAILITFSVACIFSAFAHSGKTDANGGHRDNNNKSGLGWYHYHCGGYPAHLHTNGVCPYKTKTTTKTYTSTSNSKYDEGYDDGYDEGYDEGYDDGYDEGYDNGSSDAYHDGYVDGCDDGYEEGYQARIEETTAERKKEAEFLLYITLGAVGVALLVKFIKKHRKS